MTDPFDELADKIDALIKAISVLKSIPQQSNAQPPKDQFKYIPILDIFNSKLMSPPTFYNRVKDGDIDLYKFGRKSFVNKEQFESAFTKVEV